MYSVYIALTDHTLRSNTLNSTNIGETRLDLIERIQGQYRGKTILVSDEEKAYIAGFLDGDGSIMAQLVYRKDYKLGYQIRISIVFYQKTKHRKFLVWLKSQLGYGYVRNRNDGMSEYTIVGLSEVKEVLTLLYPFLHLKKDLAKTVLSIIDKHPPSRKMTASKLLTLSKLVDVSSTFNYTKKRTNSSKVVEIFLKARNLSP